MLVVPFSSAAGNVRFDFKKSKYQLLHNIRTMKKLIYFYFLDSRFCAKLQYALGEAPIKTVNTPQGVNNQPEEIEYFKAHLLPIEKKATPSKL
jgi:hypothetical protein